MNNLRTATQNLHDWVLEPGDDYYELETHYLQNLTQWNRYAEHAAAAVGGSWTHHKRYGEEGIVYTPIEPEYQRGDALHRRARAADAGVGARLRHAAPPRARGRRRADPRVPGAGRAAAAEPCAAGAHDRARGVPRRADVPPAEMLDDAREMVWREVRQNRAVDTYRRNLQRAYLDQAHHLLHEADVEALESAVVRQPARQQ
jgi:hypothetical protein